MLIQSFNTTCEHATHAGNICVISVTVTSSCVGMTALTLSSASRVQMPRSEVVKRMWQIVKERDLKVGRDRSSTYYLL